MPCLGHSFATILTGFHYRYIHSSLRCCHIQSNRCPSFGVPCGLPQLQVCHGFCVLRTNLCCIQKPTPNPCVTQLLSKIADGNMLCSALWQAHAATSGRSSLSCLLIGTQCPYASLWAGVPQPLLLLAAGAITLCY